MKVSIVHDWIIDLGGAEKCLREIYSLFSNADVFTLISKEESLRRLNIPIERVKNSYVSKIPKVEKVYRNLLFLFPLAIEQFDTSEYDLVISSSHAVAKGVITNSDQLHICYCYTPMRYVWDLYHYHLNKLGKLRRTIAKPIFHYLRTWDVVSSSRVDHFVAISNYVAKRIRKIYRREATVIYPPVDVKKFSVYTKKEDFYLTVSRLVPYKEVELIVRAFSFLPEKKLIVIGSGPDLKKLKKIASRNVEILGYQPFEKVKYYLERAKAFIFAAVEDFGIAVIEAQACGTPVIALQKGGVTETVINGKTGFFFKEQKVDSIISVIKLFEKEEEKLDLTEIRKNAERFDKAVFREKFKQFVNKKAEDFFS